MFTCKLYDWLALLSEKNINLKKTNFVPGMNFCVSRLSTLGTNENFLQGQPKIDQAH